MVPTRKAGSWVTRNKVTAPAMSKSLSEVARTYGVAEGTLYRWRSKFGDMDQAEMKCLKELEDENRRLKQ